MHSISYGGINLLELILLVIGILLLVGILGYILLDYLITRFFKAPYPHNTRGALQEGYTEELLAVPLSKYKIMLRKWSQSAKNLNAILFVHGWDSSMGYFQDLIPFFQRHDFDVFGLDYRSHGDSDHQKLISIYNIADDISATVRYIHDHHPNSKLVLFGHSLGGVASIVGQGNGQIPQEYIATTITEGIYSHGRYILYRFIQEYNAPELIGKLVTPIIRRKILSTIPNEHPKMGTAHDLLLMNPQLQITRISNPVYMLHAVNDHVVSIEELRTFAALNNPNVTTIELQDGNHFKTHLYPQYFEVLESILKQIS